MTEQGAGGSAVDRSTSPKLIRRGLSDVGKRTRPSKSMWYRRIDGCVNYIAYLILLIAMEIPQASYQPCFQRRKNPRLRMFWHLRIPTEGTRDRFLILDSTLDILLILIFLIY